MGNGSQIISGFEFGSTADFAVLAGQALSVDLFDADSGDKLTDTPIDVSIPSTGSWTFVAHLGPDESPMITSFQNDRTPTSDGQGRITFRHVAAAPSVDVTGGDGTVFAETVANANGASFAVPAGMVDDLQLAVAGDDTAVDIPLIEVASGQEVTVYAVGSLVGETFDFLALSAVEVGTESGEATTTTVDTATTTTVDTAATTTTTTPVPGRVDTGAAHLGRVARRPALGRRRAACALRRASASSFAAPVPLTGDVEDIGDHRCRDIGLVGFGGEDSTRCYSRRQYSAPPPV